MNEQEWTDRKITRPECEHRITKLEDAVFEINKVCNNDIPHMAKRINQILAAIVLLAFIVLSMNPELFKFIFGILKKVL